LAQKAAANTLWFGVIWRRREGVAADRYVGPIVPLLHFIRRKTLRATCALMAAALLAELSPAQAQGTDPTPGQAAPAGAAPPASAMPQQGDGSVASRVGRLEGQIADLQIMIGTLESLLREKPGATLQHEAPPGPGADSNLAPRVDALETQIGALTNQLERIGRQLASIEARRAETPQSLTPPQNEPDGAPSGFRQGLAPISPWETASSEPEQDNPRARWYGPPPGASATEAPAGPQERTAALPGGDAASLYRQAYGDLLQQDYPAAEAAFRQFLALYPSDKLAGNAQYWLGETHYARGDYKSAADAYLKGYKTYQKSEKASDTLLKLGMSLAALGQKQEACSTFGELDAKYPKAPAAVRDQAKNERAKAGC
jgi:tol-pal system protein YbgF